MKHIDNANPCDNEDLTSGGNELARSKYITNRIASDEGIEDEPNEEIVGHDVPSANTKGILLRRI